MGPEAVQERDPVCGMAVDPSGPLQHRHDGTIYHFCSQRCLTRFQDESARYASGAPASEAAAPAEAGGRWTCPMHPEIVRAGPGSCPICGMALEPMSPGGE